MLHPRSRTKSRFALALATAAVAAGLTAGSVLAGEVNGTYTKFQFSQGRSVCKFSGLNDNPTSTNPANPPGRVQSYGYSFVRNGLKALVPSPGFACNPNNDFQP